MKALPLGIGTRQVYPLSPLLFNIALEVLAATIRQEKKKGIQIGKEEVKLSLFVDDMILFIENSKDTTKKLLELLNKFSKFAGYKINIQNSIAFLYTNNKLSLREIPENNPLTVLSRKIQYLGINLTKGMRDLCAEN